MREQHRRAKEMALVTRESVPEMLEGVRRREEAGTDTLAEDLERVRQLVVVTSKTIKTWYFDGLPTFERDRWVPSDVDLGAFLLMGGYRPAHALLVAGGVATAPTAQTFYRGTRAYIGGDAGDLIRFGPAKWRGLRLIAQGRLSHRNGCVELDFVELPVLVSLDAGIPPVKMKLGLAIEQKYRCVAGLTLALEETALAGLATLSDAIELRPWRSPVHGVFDCVLVDGGSTGLSDAGQIFAAGMGIDLAVLPRRGDELKPIVERLNLTVVREVTVGLPNEINPRLLDHHGRRTVGKEPVVSLEWLVEVLLDWLWHYNYERPHSSLGDRTPAEAYLADKTSKPRLPTESQRRTLRRDQHTVTATREGIKLHGRRFWSPEMTVGKEYLAMSHIDDLEVVDFYDRHKHVCTCRADAPATDGELAVLGSKRRQVQDLVKGLSDARQRVQDLFVTDASIAAWAKQIDEQEETAEPEAKSKPSAARKRQIGGAREKDMQELLARAGGVIHPPADPHLTPKRETRLVSHRKPKPPRHTGDPEHRPGTLETPSLLRTLELLDRAMPFGSAILLAGPAGVGKTYAAEWACYERGLAYATLRFHAQQHASPLKLARALYFAIHGFIPKGTSDEILSELRDDLAATALIFDEVHRAPLSALLWMIDAWREGQDKTVLICIGAEKSAKHLDEDMMVGRRIRLRGQFQSLPPGWLRLHVPSCHQILRDAAPEVLDFVAEHGDERNIAWWHDFALYATHNCRVRNLTTLDRQAAIETLTLMGYL